MGGIGGLTLRHVRRGGAYFRVADPDWRDPLDGRYAAERGGRWNPPRSFPVVYLNREIAVARANVALRFAGRPYTPELLNPEEAPVLVETLVSEEDYVDVVTDAGCVAVGLPVAYPRDERGEALPHGRCQAIGSLAWAAGANGVACRSAARAAPPAGEELAWFQQPGRVPLPLVLRHGFDEWFWGGPHTTL